MSVKKISRRDAMKLLGAAIGGAALSTLPSKWNTPELAAGVLPAHAQQSAVLPACPLSLTLIPNYNDDDNGLVNNITIQVSPAPAAGTIVSYSLINILPVNKLSGALSGTSTTDAGGTAYFSGTVTYLGTSTYSLLIRIETLGCYREIPVIRA